MDSLGQNDMPVSGNIAYRGLPGQGGVEAINLDTGAIVWKHVGFASLGYGGVIMGNDLYFPDISKPDATILWWLKADTGKIMGKLTVSDGDPTDSASTQPYLFGMFQMAGDNRCIYYGCWIYDGIKPVGVVRVNVDAITQYGTDGTGNPLYKATPEIIYSSSDYHQTMITKPYFENGVVYFIITDINNTQPTATNWIIAMDESTKHILWQIQPKYISGGDRNEILSVGSDLLITDAGLGLVQKSDGTIIYETPGLAQGAGDGGGCIANGKVYATNAADSNNGVTSNNCYDIASGAKLWGQHYTQTDLGSTPAVAHNIEWLATEDGVYFYNATTGTPLGSCTDFYGTGDAANSNFIYNGNIWIVSSMSTITAVKLDLSLDSQGNIER